MRAALADFSVGRMPGVEAILRADPEVGGATAEQAARASAAQRSPDAAFLAEREASESAAKRSSESAQPTDAEKSLSDATERLEAMRRKLEATGIKREELDRLVNLESFDEEVRRAKSAGEVSKIGAICGAYA